MRGCILMFGLVLFASRPHNVHAQLLGDPDTAGGVKLTVEPIRSTAPLPMWFVIRLTNVSHHDLRLPKPALECGDVANGSVYLHGRFLPSQSSGPLTGSGCVADSFHVPILDQLKRWNTLAAGESLRFDIELTRVVPNAPAAGTYTIWADYTPPYVSPAELKLLDQNGIAVPTSSLATTPVEYRVAVH